jgi:hypothetical protein
MGKHRELAKELYASRIWRTVVFAGAMLGGPTIAGADQVPVQAQPANPAPKPPAQASKPDPAAAQAPRRVPPDPAVEKQNAITTANTERSDLLAKLADTDVKELDKLKKQIVAKDAQIKKLVDELIAMRKPRPRTPPEVRPVGRGFILA